MILLMLGTYVTYVSNPGLRRCIVITFASGMFPEKTEMMYYNDMSAMHHKVCFETCPINHPHPPKIHIVMTEWVWGCGG